MPLNDHPYVLTVRETLTASYAWGIIGSRLRLQISGKKFKDDFMRSFDF